MDEDDELSSREEQKNPILDKFKLLGSQSFNESMNISNFDADRS